MSVYMNTSWKNSLDYLKQQDNFRTILRVPNTTVGDFASNDYLGLRNDPRVIEAGCLSARKYGAGSGASRIVMDQNESISEVEFEFSKLTGFVHSLFLPSGFSANIACIETLAPFYFEKDLHQEIFLDHRCHASLFYSIKHSGLKYCHFKHNSLNHLEHKLKASRAHQKVIVLESLYSMDGDFAPQEGLTFLCAKYSASIILDESHSIGLYGQAGSGWFSLALNSDGNLKDYLLAITAGCGKALGVSGGFVATNNPFFYERMLQRAKAFIYSTSPAPFITGALKKSIDIVASAEGDLLRNCLFSNIHQAAHQISRLDRSHNSPILPYIVGDNIAAVNLSEQLRQEGFLVRPMRPPTVPQGSARLRIALHAFNTRKEIEQLSLFLSGGQA